MQNIPGLSFFDGLTRSRPSQGTRSPATESPLRDATSFSSLRNVKSSDFLNNDKPLQEQEFSSSDAFEDPLSSSSSSISSSSLPAASFSRRAATVSAGSSSLPGTPSRRTTGSSTTATRSSILSKDSIFSTPTMTRRSSSTSENSATSGRDRSESNASKETEEPTAKDVSLMAQGTQAYSMLKRIQEHPIELADIIRMLVTKKAILILPTCAASTEEPTPTRATYEDHVIIPESSYGESLFVTLSGIRGVLKPHTSSISILGLATGHDFGTIATDAAGPTKRSFFDNISKSDGPEGSISGDSSKELKLVNSSKRPVVIYVESVGSIHALLVDNIIPKPEGDAIPTPIIPLATGIATLKDRSAARRTASSSSSVRSMNLNDDKDGTPLPKLPKIASDIPLEWDSVLRDLESFVVKLKKNPLPNIDRYANEFQRKYDDVRHRFEAYGNASGMKNRWGDQDFDEVQQWIEAWLCREMYTIIFPHSPHGMNGRDYLQDEQLQAKIAALNFMDLSLEHLGFVLEHPEDVEHIAQVVREGGTEMQKLALVKSPSDKMNVILSSHRVVVDALNRDPAVQDLIVETETERIIEVSTKGDVASEDINSPTTLRSNKRISLPKIPMDGNIPQLNVTGSATSILPKIPMDEGYDRPFLDKNENEIQTKDGTESTTLSNEATLSEVTKENEEPKAEESKTEGSETEESNTEGSKVEEQDSKVNTGEEKYVQKVDLKTETSKPENVALPASPAPESSPIPSLVISGTDVAASTVVTEVTATATPSSSSPSPRKQYSADVLLPLLIFSVVKSNPPMLISNLSYIQRFKVQDQLTGELAYCLTNMMAVVSFLETLDPHALGLSNDVRVLSDISDIQASIAKFNSREPAKINFQEGLDQTKALGQKVSQELVVAAEEGIKVISDVVQDGYSKFLGRFLNNTDSGTSSLSFGINNNSKPSGILTRNKRALSAASSLAATAAASVAADEKRRAAWATASTSTDEKNRGPAGLASDLTNIDKSSPYESAMEHAARSRVLEYIRTSQGPQLQFMACMDSDNLRLCDVKGLLEDYQRIGKILEEMKRLA